MRFGLDMIEHTCPNLSLLAAVVLPSPPPQNYHDFNTELQLMRILRKVKKTST